MYIRARKDVLQRLFVNEWPKRGWWDRGQMSGRMPPSKHLFTDEALGEGERIKLLFGYNQASGVPAILQHFRFLYQRMYPDEISL